LTDSKSEPESASSCSIISGGKKLSDAEQKAQLKKVGRLGVLPGDEICNISTFCWTIENADRFRKKCAEVKEKDDDSLGFYSCVLVVAQGEDDVKRFRFFDDDTKCIFQVRGGPSNVDNDLIGKCARPGTGGSIFFAAWPSLTFFACSFSASFLASSAPAFSFLLHAPASSPIPMIKAKVRIARNLTRSSAYESRDRRSSARPPGRGEAGRRHRPDRIRSRTRPSPWPARSSTRSRRARGHGGCCPRSRSSSPRWSSPTYTADT
jgi:hypothetical protein